MDGGCLVPVSHKLNQDGYFRKTWAAATGGKVTEFFHRFIYRALNGLDAIPSGHEIDHECGNRACQNPTHLRLLPRPVHLEITNRHRYAPRLQAALAYWRETGCSGADLGSRFGVTSSTGCRWIKEATP